jgi:hypothetical protein
MLASETTWPPDHELAPGSPIAGPRLPTPELRVCVSSPGHATQAKDTHTRDRVSFRVRRL